MLLQRDVGRTCGECNACCKPFKVPEVDKNDANWCKHCILGNGCAIYRDRPLACQLYACMWLNGFGTDDFRPDRLGVILDSEDFQLPDRMVGVLHFLEVREGALGQSIIEEIAGLNLEQGAAIEYHQISGDTDIKSLRVRRRFFSTEETKMIQNRRK